ncbi:MAG: hypothetical protein M1839_008590 [Geoglossum umbratile]|nr:MAG: hypothetical protein M1839_008590 [Geoglossum umbratile]
MQLTVAYAISVAAVVGAFTLYRVGTVIARVVRMLRTVFILKHLCYPVLWRRRSGSTDMTRLQGILTALFIAANILCSLIGVRNVSDLNRRSGILSLINMMPMFLGGRTNLFADLLGLRLDHYGTLHRWIGRVCVLQGILHGSITFFRPKSDRNYKEYLLFSALLAVFISSLLFIRRLVFELFLKVHLTLAVVVLGSLWLHLRSRGSIYTLYFLVGSAIWLLSFFGWAILLMYRNVRRGHSTQVAIKELYDRNDGPITAARISITLKRPWKFLPGQYVYLTIPSVGYLGLLQAHPYAVCWWGEGSFGEPIVVLLAQARRGFSRRLPLAQASATAIIDGPYGTMHNLEGYDKILICADGIGIAAQLSYIRYILECHNLQTARVRRLSVVWQLEKESHWDWVREYIEEILSKDILKILNIYFYMPPQSMEENNKRNSDQLIKQPYTIYRNLDMKELVAREDASEAGNMIVSVCGTPSFEKYVRDSVRSNSRDIRLVNSCFQPDEVF